MRVLIVEDEVRLAETLRDLLELERYTADICHDGESGLDNALSDIYDLVILDVMLPKKDGFSVLRALRQAGKTVPVLMLSARSELADRVEGLDCGADYYLTKPFEPKELLACVRMLTRRQPEQRASQNLEYGDLRLETDTFQLSCGERSVRLSRKEFDMLELLMRQKGRLISTEQFMERIWGYDSDTELNVVWAYISYLRRKLEMVGSNVRIAARRGQGYLLEEIA